MFFWTWCGVISREIGTIQINARGSTYVFATVVDKIHGNYREKSLQLKLRILHNNNNKDLNKQTDSKLVTADVVIKKAIDELNSVEESDVFDEK